PTNHYRSPFSQIVMVDGCFPYLSTGRPTPPANAIQGVPLFGTDGRRADGLSEGSAVPGGRPPNPSAWEPAGITVSPTGRSPYPTGKSPLPPVVAPHAPRLFLQGDFLDHHGPVVGFAHVVQGQGCNRGRGEGFHLHPRLRDGARRSLDAHPHPLIIRVGLLLDMHLHGTQRDRVAEGDEARRLFGRHNAREPGHRERVALGQGPFPHE